MKINKVDSVKFSGSSGNSQPLKPQAQQPIKDEFIKQKKEDMNASYEKEQKEKAIKEMQRKLEEQKKFQKLISKPQKFKEGNIVIC